MPDHVPAEGDARGGARGDAAAGVSLAPDASLSDLLLAVTRRLRGRWSLALEPWGLSPHQARALRVIGHAGHEGDGVRLSDLAAALRIVPRSATEVVDALQERQLVERVHDPADRRAVLVRLTDTGREVSEQIAAARSADAAGMFAALAPEERDHLTRLLRTLLDG